MEEKCMNDGQPLFYTEVGMIHRRKLIVTAAGALVVFLLVVFIFNRNSGTVTRPRVAPLVEAVYALGTVKADRWYAVRFGMSTIIRKLYVVEGQSVRRGDPLVMTDSSIVFNSPISGVVSLIGYRENEMVPAGQQVLLVSNLDDMYVRVPLDQESIVRVRKGQTAELSFENLRTEKVTGRVESVYPSGTEFIVRVNVDSFPDGVLPEMTCDTAIVIHKKERALMVPASSVTNGKITIIRKGKRMKVPVEVRAVDGQWHEILNDSVKQDDRIVNGKDKERRGKGNGKNS